MEDKATERDYDYLKSSYDSLLSDYDSILKENEKLKLEVFLIPPCLFYGHNLLIYKNPWNEMDLSVNVEFIHWTWVETFQSFLFILARWNYSQLTWVLIQFFQVFYREMLKYTDSMHPT